MLMQFSVIFSGGVKFRMRAGRNTAFLFHDDRTKHMLLLLSSESIIFIEKNTQTSTPEFQKYLFCLMEEDILILVR